MVNGVCNLSLRQQRAGKDKTQLDLTQHLSPPSFVELPGSAQLKCAAFEVRQAEGAVLSVKGARSNAQLKTLTLTFLGHQS